MRCKDVITILEEAREDALPENIREHLSHCSDCREAWKDLRLLRAGFHLLAEESVPEPSIGFATRVLRRLSQAADSGRNAQEFLERVGRRMVFAGSLLAIVLLLAVALPASGPLRGPAADEPFLSRAELSSQDAGMSLADDLGENRASTPANSSKGNGLNQK